MITIIGGGLAGLSAAYHLDQEYQLFEATTTAGGIASSYTIDGFTFDHAIHVLFTKDPYARTLIRSLLGSNFKEHHRSSWIYSHNTYTTYPYQSNLRGLPAKVIAENIAGILWARAQKSKSAPVSFEQWIMNQFGPGIAKHFMLPLNEKTWAIEPGQMNCDWMTDRVQNPKVWEMLRGAVRSSSSYGPNAMFWYPVQGGMAALTNAFIKSIKQPWFGKRCVGIDPKNREVRFSNGMLHSYSKAIVSLPLPKIISFLKDPPTEILKAAKALKWNKVTTVNLGIDRERMSDKHWIYVPEKKMLFHRLSFPANFSSSLVPAGTSSIMAEISSSVWRPLPAMDLIETTIRQLRQMQLLRKTDKVLVTHLKTIEPAYVIYDHKRSEAVKIIHQYLRSVNIIPCGRFGEWAYLNMDQTILSGKRAAEEVIRYQ